MTVNKEENANIACQKFSKQNDTLCLAEKNKIIHHANYIEKKNSIV
jgi:hypothetical protein